jgi:hypothetical protein
MFCQVNTELIVSVYVPPKVFSWKITRIAQYLLLAVVVPTALGLNVELQPAVEIVGVLVEKS